MPYTYSTIAPTPAWITVDSLTGLVTVNKANAPINGFTGIARFQVSDGAATAIQDVSINILAKYTVTTEYKELLSHRWVAKAVSRTNERDPATIVRWTATALSRTNDVAVTAVSNSLNRLVQFQRQFQPIASLPPINRLVQFDRSLAPEAGTFSTAIAPLLGTAGLVDLGFFNTTTPPLPFEFNFGVTVGFAATAIYRFQNRIYFDSGNFTQWIEVNNSASTNFLGWHGGGDADKYRIRWEGQDAAGGNPLIWEITFFREGVIQVVTGTLGNNTGNNQITPPNTPIAFVDNTSFVINYLRSGSNSYIIRQGSYTV